VEGALAGCCGLVALLRSMWVERKWGLSSNNMGIVVGGYPVATEGTYVGCSGRAAPFRMLMERGGVATEGTYNMGIVVGGYPVATEGTYVGCSGRAAPFRMLMERGGVFLGVGVWMKRGGGLSSNNMGIVVGGYPVATEGTYVGCSGRATPFRMLKERGSVFLGVGGLLRPIPWLEGGDRAVEGALAGCGGRVALFRSMWVEGGGDLSSNNMGIVVGGYPTAVEGS
jgi:hypothetical protein